jgi:hypothetical protein
MAFGGSGFMRGETTVEFVDTFSKFLYLDNILMKRKWPYAYLYYIPKIVNLFIDRFLVAQNVYFVLFH